MKYFKNIKQEREEHGERKDGDLQSLLFSSGLSNMADGVSRGLYPLIALEYTKSGFLMGLLNTMNFFPWIMFSIWFGVLIDKGNIFKIIKYSACLRVLVLVVLSFLMVSGNLNFTLLGIGLFSLATLEVLFDSVSQAIVPHIVDKGDILQANAKIYTYQNISNHFLGKPIGSFLAQLSLFSGVLGHTIFLFFSMVSTLFLKPRKQFSKREDESANETYFESAMGGFKFLKDAFEIKIFILISCVVNFCVATVNSVFVLYLVEEKGFPKWSFGLILTSFAIGGVVAAIFLKRFQSKFKSLTILKINIIGQAIGFLLMAHVFHYIQAFFIGFFLSFHANSGDILINTYIQKLSPLKILGRVTSIFNFFSMGVMTVGSILGGFLAEFFDIFRIYQVMACILIILLFYVQRKNILIEE